MDARALTKAWIGERRDNPALEPLKAAGLVLHGLRATAVVRLSRLGANTRQIAELVGMSEKMVARYCRHSSQQENASAAILIWRNAGVNIWAENDTEHAIRKPLI